MNNSNKGNQRIACCISGRPSNRILDHLRYLLPYRPKMDFFIFFWDTIDQMTKEKVRMCLQPIDVSYQAQISFPFDAMFKEPDKKQTKNDALSMFYGISQAQKLRQKHEKKIGKKYDMVIRFRYDLHFFSDLMEIIQNALRNIDGNSIVCPWNNHHIGICDQIWFGSPLVMDKFANLFDWIRDNISKLFFVNENVLYRFLCANEISVKCIEMRYIIRRDQMLSDSQQNLFGEYNRQQTLPWVVSCPERKEKYYQTYILNRNESANTLFFFTKQIYCDIPCRILNRIRNKYIFITPQNYSTGIQGCNNASHFFIHVFNSYSVNVIVNNAELSHVKDKRETNHKTTKLYLATSGNKLICSTDPNNSNSQFFFVKKNDIYYFIQNKPVEERNIGLWWFMDQQNNIFANGLCGTAETQWTVI